MAGSTTPFQACIIFPGSQKTLVQKFSTSQRALEHHLHKVASAGSRLSPFTQADLFPKVILQKKVHWKTL